MGPRPVLKYKFYSKNVNVGRLLRVISIIISNYRSYGEKYFSFYGQSVWNSLPVDLRKIENVDTLKTFENILF